MNSKLLYNKCIDIVLITETHFIQYSKIYDIQIYIPGYKLTKITIWTIQRMVGSVAILVKSTILFQVPPYFCQDFLKSFAILIKSNNIPIAIAIIYSPPRYNLTNANFQNYFSTYSNNFINGRNYNAKHQSWDCRINNPRSVILHNFTSVKQFKIFAPPGQQLEYSRHFCH